MHRGGEEDQDQKRGWWKGGGCWEVGSSLAVSNINHPSLFSAATVYTCFILKRIKSVVFQPPAAALRRNVLRNQKERSLA